MAKLKNKSKTGSVIFALLMLLYIAAVSAVILFVYKKVGVYAQEHENALPAKVMDAYIADKNQNLLTGSVLEEISNMPHDFQSDAEVGEIVRQMFSSELSYARTVGGDGENTLVYAILCDGRSFGKVTMTRDQSKAGEVEFGELPWIITNEEYDFSELYSSHPCSISLACNGQNKKQVNGTAGA